MRNSLNAREILPAPSSSQRECFRNQLSSRFVLQLESQFSSLACKQQALEHPIICFFPILLHKYFNQKLPRLRLGALNWRSRKAALLPGCELAMHSKTQTKHKLACTHDIPDTVTSCALAALTPTSLQLHFECQMMSSLLISP